MTNIRHSVFDYLKKLQQKKKTTKKTFATFLQLYLEFLFACSSSVWLKQFGVMHAMTIATVYVYSDKAVMQFGMLRRIVGNRLWQSEKEMKSYNIFGFRPAVAFWPHPS